MAGRPVADLREALVALIEEVGLSLTRTTSGATTSSRPCRSPASSARWNDSIGLFQ
ncbi:hypothetical protein ABZ297_29375 [Nonomuraea sp. NPDC005983]|uniref:hypothetical protein n=1 Tax=Nonomuraea sp. NPDC005983 TaxID=3155595 RepID=UPI0033BE5C1F